MTAKRQVEYEQFLGRKWGIYRLTLESNSAAYPHLEYCGASSAPQKVYNRAEREKKLHEKRMIRGTKLFLHKSFSNSLSRLKITQDEEYGICNSVKDQQGTSDYCFCKMTTSWDPVKSDLKPTEVLLYTAQLHHRCSCHRIWEQNSSKRHGLHRLSGCETSGFS